MIEIRLMKSHDLDNLSSTLQKDFDSFWSFSILKQELTNPNSTYFVARAEKEIVGFAGIWRSIDDVHIMDIVVKKTERKQGIGSMLLETLIKQAKKEHFAAITLEVRENNLEAISLYEKYHFIRMGLRKKYYNNKENAVIMTLSLK